MPVETSVRTFVLVEIHPSYIGKYRSGFSLFLEVDACSPRSTWKLHKTLDNPGPGISTALFFSVIIAVRPSASSIPILLTRPIMASRLSAHYAEDTMEVASLSSSLHPHPREVSMSCYTT